MQMIISDEQQELVIIGISRFLYPVDCFFILPRFCGEGRGINHVKSRWQRDRPSNFLNKKGVGRLTERLLKAKQEEN